MYFTNYSGTNGQYSWGHIKRSPAKKDLTYFFRGLQPFFSAWADFVFRESALKASSLFCGLKYPYFWTEAASKRKISCVAPTKLSSFVSLFPKNNKQTVFFTWRWLPQFEDIIYNTGFNESAKNKYSSFCQFFFTNYVHFLQINFNTATANNYGKYYAAHYKTVTSRMPLKH